MTEPRTAAGRRLLDIVKMDGWTAKGENGPAAYIRAIESEATADAGLRMRAMRHDYQTLPHAEFPTRWPDWRDYEEVLPTYCSCQECRLWRSGS